MKNKLLLFYLIVILNFPIFSAEVIANRIVNQKNFFTVGDKVKVEIKVKLDRGETYESITDESVDGIDIYKKREKKDNELLIVREYQIFSLDIKKLPDILLKIKDKKGKIYSMKIKGRKIQIKQISKDDKLEDIIPPQKNLNTNWSPFPLILTILFILLLLIFIYFLLRKLRKRKEKRKEPRIWEKEIDPIEFLTKELNRIKRQDYIERQEFKTFYYDITEVLKNFFSIYYKKNYIDKTTFEFKKDFEEKIENELKEKIFSFLEFSDMVKFAKFRPNKDQVKEGIKLGDDILEYYKRIKENTVNTDNVNL